MGVEKGRKFGLIGTITHDTITFDSGEKREGPGGVLYQAAVLCALRKEVVLFTHVGEELVHDVEKIIRKWSSLTTENIRVVPGPGNRVRLHYPEQGERIEILESVVPPLPSEPILEKLPLLSLLILIVNSGFDIDLKEWRRLVRAAECPLWIDIHSLPLARKLNARREYLSFSEWEDWAEGVHFVQANRKEIASMLGHPQKLAAQSEIMRLGEEAFRLGVKALFITLGREGVMVLTPERSDRLTPVEKGEVVDTTGCGDVFCAAAASKIIDGESLLEAASHGISLASKAASVHGVEETYRLIQAIEEIQDE
ncbi:MAG: carbohydrate kinase family protein [Candidatus Aminicenantales bacterium]